MSETNPYLPLNVPAGDDSRNSPAGMDSQDTAAIHFAGRLSVRDLLRGRWLRVGIAGLARHGIYFAALVFLFSQLLRTHPGDRAADIISIAVAFVVYTAVLAILILLLWSKFRRGVGPFQLHETWLTLKGFRQHTDAADIDLRWDFFRSHRISERVAIVFFRRSRQYLILSRALLERDDDWPRVRQLLAERLPS